MNTKWKVWTMSGILMSGAMTGMMASVGASAADLEFDPTHAHLGFEIKHLMISTVRGQFKDYNTKIDYNEKDPAKSKAEIVIKASSIDTNNKDRDDHLRSPDFFDTSKYPEIRFVSTSATPSGKGKFKLEGNLTIKNVTRKVTFDVVEGGRVKDPWGNDKIAFAASSKINRKDYGLTWNKVLETGGFAVGEDVKLAFEFEAAVKKPQTASK